MRAVSAPINEELESILRHAIEAELKLPNGINIDYRYVITYGIVSFYRYASRDAQQFTMN